MKKIIALILLICTLMQLASCGSREDGVPDGMQIVRSGEKYGYTMYAPEEWTVANYGDISSAYASNVDTTSVSFIEINAPEGTVLEYFNDSLKEYPTPPTIITENADVTFGNADNAKKFVFEHEYSGHKFRTMQIFAGYNGRFGIFTFNSVLENISSSEVVQYDYYEEKVANVIKYFTFTAKTGEDDKKTYPKDDEGYILVSDKSVVKYALYVPEEFAVEHASGLTTVSLNDGSNLTLSRATTTGIAVDEYWENRKKELKALVGDITEISANKVTNLGNSKHATAYEYTFVYNNTTYHVYQVLAVTTFNGFVFTYTAAEENYEKHLDTIMKIAEKVEF